MARAAKAEPTAAGEGKRGHVKGRRAGAGSILLAFILGAVSGAAVALLYAPASGRETREYLGERADEARAKARPRPPSGREVINQGRETSTSAIDSNT